MSADLPSLFERLGGNTGLDALTQAFYDRVLADDALRPFFANTPMEKLRAMQREFFAGAVGGPTTYTGKPLAHAHQGRGIKTEHFSKFVQHLLETLRAHGATAEDAYEVITRLNTQANEITGTSY